jgi:predicted acetylornithine/succinylornithine family transaminase
MVDGEVQIYHNHSSFTNHQPEEPMLTELESQDDAAQIMALDRDYVMGTYARQPIVFVRGEGARLWDSAGREYLDFLAGIAVVQVGHCHPRIAQAIAAQAGKLMHVSNLYHNALQARLAERLCGHTHMEKAFFCNSGAEANEAALKIARKWGKQKRGADCYEIITFEGSFHGRTMGTVTATAQPKYQAPFAPLVPGFHYAPLNDLKALDNLISERTCAVMIEPIQGESGIKMASPEFLAGVRALCDEAEVLLILDEVQCGMGRTGCFLGSQRAGVQGDIVTMAKGIADGFPMGACLARGEAANTLVPGDHGSTFAGQPLACAAAMATLDVIEDERLMERAAAVGAHFRAGVEALQAAVPGRIKEVRGVGLMIGVEFVNPEAKLLLTNLLEQGIVANAVGDTVLRFVPPLVVTNADCDRVVTALQTALG